MAAEHGIWRQLSWPNRISLMRLAGIGPFVVLLLHQGEWPWARHAALALFVAMGLSDALDGHLARRNGQTSRLGTILDPLADKLLINSAVILLVTDAGGVPGVPLDDWVAVAVVAKDIWVVLGFAVVFLVTGRRHGRPTWAGKGSTLVQIVTVSVVLVGPEINAVAAGLGSALARGLGWAVVLFAALCVVSYSRQGLAELLPHEHENAGPGASGPGQP